MLKDKTKAKLDDSTDQKKVFEQIRWWTVDDMYFNRTVPCFEAQGCCTRPASRLDPCDPAMKNHGFITNDRAGSVFSRK